MRCGVDDVTLTQEMRSSNLNKDFDREGYKVCGV